MSRAQAILAIDEGIAKFEAVRAFLVAEAAEQPTVAPSAPQAAPAGGAGLAEPTAFYDALRASGILGPTLSDTEVAGCQAVLDAAAGVLPAPWCAYALATTHHETGGEMKGNVENLVYTTPERIQAVWPSRFPTVASARPYVRAARALANKVYNGRMGNRPGSDDGWDFRGRGQSHITGRDNYERADRELGLNGALVADPDLALRPDIAARILVLGMRDGWFTGRGFNHFINNQATEAQFTAARKIINPDRNGPAVAKLALVYLDCLKAGEWR